jgi:formylglycine-generating enzyme
MKRFRNGALLPSTVLLALTVCMVSVQAQEKMMYIMKKGCIVQQVVLNQVDIKRTPLPGYTSDLTYKQPSTPIDSVVFSKPVIDIRSGISTVPIPAGTFIMGSPTTEYGRSSAGGENQHTVTLTAFRMSKYCITNAQYCAFLQAKGIGKDGLYAAGAYPTQPLIMAAADSVGLIYDDNRWVPIAGYEDHPADRVGWFGATEFATYVGGRLPTDAQWEYACRAGTTTVYSCGDCLDYEHAFYPSANNAYHRVNGVLIMCPKVTIAGVDPASGFGDFTQPVGSHAPNPWGLYDMHGNTAQWCSDWYNPQIVLPSGETDPTGITADQAGINLQRRVFRGGKNPTECRSANRNGDSGEANLGWSVGFRVVFVP